MVRGQKVLLDTDLASLYGVTVRRLNEQVRRNSKRFPDSFVFHLTFNELRANWSQIATSSKKYRGPARLPLAFTKLRELLASNTELARKLEALEKSVATLDVRTRRQFEEVYSAIRALMAPPGIKSRPIGFTAKLE